VKYREESNRYYVKFEREKRLDKVRKELIFSLQVGLAHLKSMNPPKLPYVVTLLDETIDDNEVKRAILAGALYEKDGRGIDYLICDKPPKPPIDVARQFVSLLPPAPCQKIIDSIKAWYPEDEHKLFDTPLPVKRPGAIPVDQARSHASRLSPTARKVFLDIAKEKSDYTEEELKILDAPYE